MFYGYNDIWLVIKDIRFSVFQNSPLSRLKLLHTAKYPSDHFPLKYRTSLIVSRSCGVKVTIKNR